MKGKRREALGWPQLCKGWSRSVRAPVPCQESSISRGRRVTDGFADTGISSWFEFHRVLKSLHCLQGFGVEPWGGGGGGAVEASPEALSPWVWGVLGREGPFAKRMGSWSHCLANGEKGWAGIFPADA